MNTNQLWFAVYETNFRVSSNHDTAVERANAVIALESNNFKALPAAKAKKTATRKRR